MNIHYNTSSKNYSLYAALSMFFTIGMALPLRLTADAQSPKERSPTPLRLLKTVAETRQQISSGNLEFEVSTYMPHRRSGTTNRTRLEIIFEDNNRRFEEFERQYRFVLTGDDAREVTNAKIKELDLTREEAVDAGLLSGFESHHVTIYDGNKFMDYWETDGEPYGTTISDPSDGSARFNFDPRYLGLRIFLDTEDSIDVWISELNQESLELLGKETVRGTPAWHVKVENQYGSTLHYWIHAEQPHRLLKHSEGTDAVVMKYDQADPFDPIPTEFTMAKRRNGNLHYERRMIRTRSSYNIEADSVDWSLAGLEMPIGTSVTDSRISRRIGYWTGSGLSESLPSNTNRSNASEDLPDADQMMALMENDAKSTFGLEAATWIILNTPDGPAVEQAVEVILNHHSTSDNLVRLCREITGLRHGSTVELLKTVLTANPHDKVRAHACYSLATLLKDRSQKQADSNLTQKATALFERFLNQYAQVIPDLKKTAESELSELRRLSVGKSAPEIKGEDLTGNKMKLSDFRGQVVVLNFWAGWCGPCMAMVPHERELVERMAGKPFDIVGVNADRDRQTALKAVKKENMTWKSFWDGRPGPIANSWNVHSWPTIYVIDQDGFIRYKNVRGKELDAAVEALLAEEN
jgi:thiol-disulfide isomerase/thioredoxin